MRTIGHNLNSNKGGGFWLVSLLVSLSLLTACGGSATPTTNTASGGNSSVATTTATTSVNLSSLKGVIASDGSSTVYPITKLAVEKFSALTSGGVSVKVDVSGTGAGFRKFCAGETDLSNASRPISPAEAQVCEQNKIEFIELPVAFDGLAVVVNPKNNWVDYLSVAELKKIWEPEAEGKITNWKQIRSSFPDRPLKLYGPGKDSGTFDYFTEAIVRKERASRNDYQASEDDEVLVRGIASEEGALGYFGYAYVVENPEKVKAVPIKYTENGPAILPTPESVKSTNYRPLSRPLFIYVKKSSAQRPEVREFVNYYLSKDFTSFIPSSQIGYIALDEEHYKTIAKRFNRGITGTLFPKGTEIGANLDRFLYLP